MTTLGGTAILVCTLNENRVIWKKNDNIIENSTNLIISKNLLIVKEVSENDLGEYVCDIKTYENATITIKLENISRDVHKIPFEYLIPLIIVVILFFSSIMVIVYLVYSGRKKLATEQGFVNGGMDNEGNDIYEMVERNPPIGSTFEEMVEKNSPSGSTSEDNIYSDLKTEREGEPTYQGLVTQNMCGAGRASIYENSGAIDKGDGDREQSENLNIYEPLDLDCKTKI